MKCTAEIGVFRGFGLRTKNKKTSLKQRFKEVLHYFVLFVLDSLSGKRESVHLLPALYIKQLPLPSTILPIRGTLGRVQGIVFESDFCHTNFRTTVAYDKFTNNF